MAQRDPETEWMRVEIYRRMSGGQKIEIAMQMRAQALDMVRASIRMRHPDISDDDLELEVRKRYMPPGMAELIEPLRRERARQQRG
jgi:hypothetical protein